MLFTELLECLGRLLSHEVCLCTQNVLSHRHTQAHPFKLMGILQKQGFQPHVPHIPYQTNAVIQISLYQLTLAPVTL